MSRDQVNGLQRDELVEILTFIQDTLWPPANPEREFHIDMLNSITKRMRCAGLDPTQDDVSNAVRVAFRDNPYRANEFSHWAIEMMPVWQALLDARGLKDHVVVPVFVDGHLVENLQIRLPNGASIYIPDPGECYEKDEAVVRFFRNLFGDGRSDGK